MEKIISFSERITRKRAIKFNKNHFEFNAWASGSVVCGIDEVGRGCLAGPVVSAAIIVPPHTTYQGLKDSKLLTQPERVKAFKWIDKHCFYGVGIISPGLIDFHNIWHATLLSMKRAVINLLSHCPHQPSAILVDAMPLNLFDTDYKGIAIKSFPDGERKSISIAAASIVAKVKRDTLMRYYDTVIPGYRLAQHKGYATPIHKKAVIERGMSIVHRKSFLKNIQNDQDNLLIDELFQQNIYEENLY